MIVPLILISVASLNKSNDILPFESISVSPFYASKESKIVVKTQSKSLRFEVHIQNDKYSDLIILNKEITKSGIYEYTYNNSYTRSKNKIYVRYLSNSSYINTPAVDRNIVRSSYRSISNNEGFSSKNTIVTFKSDQTYQEHTMDFAFSGFEGINVPLYYHKLNLSDFQILLDSESIPFFNCTSSLVINNYNGVFNGVDQPGESISVDLKVIRHSNGYGFALANEYYVDKETLRMYSQKENENCVKTKHIYLPINEMRNEDKFQCYLQLKEFGIDRDILVHQFEIRSMKNIFGDCNNSRYCVVREEL